jgi:hypothetical protein
MLIVLKEKVCAKTGEKSTSSKFALLNGLHKAAKVTLSLTDELVYGFGQ